MLHIHTVLCSLLRDVPVPSRQRSCVKDARAPVHKAHFIADREGNGICCGIYLSAEWEEEETCSLTLSPVLGRHTLKIQNERLCTTVNVRQPEFARGEKEDVLYCWVNCPPDAFLILAPRGVCWPGHFCFQMNLINFSLYPYYPKLHVASRVVYCLSQRA